MAVNCAKVRLRRSALLQTMKICASDNVLQVYVGALYECILLERFVNCLPLQNLCSSATSYGGSHEIVQKWDNDDLLAATNEALPCTSK